MAHLWQHDDGRDAWIATPLDRTCALPGSRARIESVLVDGGERCQLLGPSDVRLNGAPLVVGIAVLRDRDEIAVAGRRLFFGGERLATIAAYDGTDAPLCARCKRPIEAGAAAVRCPCCRTLHHQTDRLPCWTYAARCVVCEQPTALDAGYRWSPDGL
jgi:hypothetical protein